MDILTQFVSGERSDVAWELMEEKIELLGEKYPEVIRARVIFKEEKHPEERNMVCEVELSLPGPLIFAKAHEDNFEKAAAEVAENLQAQLAKRKAQWKEH